MNYSSPQKGETFNQWFERKGFRNFKAYEFEDYFNRKKNGVKNSQPPSDLWEKIVPTLRVVDDLRDHLGRPIVITSSYRSPAYNSQCPGASPNSFHKQFIALDIVVAGTSPEDVFDILEVWRGKGKFKGGLGLYDDFVHIDTRGTNATW